MTDAGHEGPEAPADEAITERASEPERAEADAQTARDRLDERRIKLAVGAFAFVLLVTVVASIHLSSLGLNFGSLVFGSQNVWRGTATTVRIAALEPMTMRLVPNITAEVRLEDDQGVRLEARGAATSLLELEVAIPEDLGPSASLWARLEALGESDEVRIPLRPMDRPGPTQARLTPHTDALAEDARPPRGPLRAYLYPWGGHLVRGMENVVDGLLLQDGQPLATRVASEAMKLDTRSDAQGHFRFEFTPPFSSEPLALFIGDAPAQKVAVPMDVRATQLRIEVEPRRFVAPGSRIFMTVWALPFRDPIHVDVWAGDMLIAGSTGMAEDGVRQLEIQLPAECHGWLRIEAYRNLVAPEGSVATDWLWVSASDAPTAADEALAALSSLPGAADTHIVSAARAAPAAARPTLVSMAMGRMTVDSPGMPMLRSTLEKRRKRVSDEIGRLRGHVHAMFALTAFLGLGLIAAWGIRHTLNVRRNMLTVMQDGVDAGELADGDRISQLANFGHLYDLVIVFAAAVMAFYGLWVLLTRISWDYIGG